MTALPLTAAARRGVPDGAPLGQRPPRYGRDTHTLRASVERRRLRAELESIVERALVALDRLDAGDEDLEDGGDDEPSLACPEGHERQVGWCRGADDDREETAP